MARRRGQGPPEPRRQAIPRPPSEVTAEERPTGPALKIEVIAIVFLGSFNPSIFQPWWLAHQGLIDASEADAAEVGIIHSEVVSFKTGPISIEVTRDRFQAQTEDASALEALRDLVLGAFGRLSHTPVSAMGLNRSTHHDMPTEEAWNGIGHRLLPKAPWEGVLVSPGTRNVTVEGRRPDEREGYIRAIFEPSAVIKHGVFQMVNDHYQFGSGDPKTQVRASEAIEVLAEAWDESLERARLIADHVLESS